MMDRVRAADAKKGKAAEKEGESSDEDDKPAAKKGTA